MAERVLLGHVAVDSGRLVVVDPSYLDGRWLREEDLHRLHVWGPEAQRLVEAMTAADDVAGAYQQEPDHWVVTPREGQLVESLQQRAELLSAETAWDVEFSYPYRTSAEIAADENQVMFLEGRPGLAVAVSTAAPGLFPVYAIVENGVAVRLEVALSER